MAFHDTRRAGAASMAAVCLLGSLTGCSTASKDISPTYISPLQYQAYDCQQLGMEVQRIQGRVTELGGRLDKAASNDAALMGVGLVLFWPALFALGGTKGQEAEYARLRGEYDAIQQAAIQKKCGGSMTSETAPAPAVAPATPAAPVATPPAAPAASAPASTTPAPTPRSPA